MWRKLFFLLSLLIVHGCGQEAFLSDLMNQAQEISSGDIILVSGGSVARTTTPYPLHSISVFYPDGSYKKTIRVAGTSELLMGLAISPDQKSLLYTIDTTDRVEHLDLSLPSIYGNYIINTNLSGGTLRSLATLSDGGTIVAESTASIEKFDSSGNRVTTHFPIALAATIMKLRKISGGRFVAVTNGGSPDSPRVYSDDGTLITTIPLSLSCANNCDPSDILELSDGRFLVSIQNASLHSLELYASDFSYIGRFYRDTTVIQGISALAQMADGGVIACSTSFNTCEKLQITGSVGVRVGSSALIGDSSVMRQPTDIAVVP